MDIKFGVFRHHSTHFRPRAAFTLIELLMVIAIIGILASLIIVSLQGAGTKARDTKAKSNAANVDKALSQYEIDNGQLFPSAVTQNSTLVSLASLVPNYLKTTSALTPVTGKAAQYISNYARTSYAQAWELENTTEAAITSGNGVYAANSANAGGVIATPAKGSAITFGPTTTITLNEPGSGTNLHPAAFSISFWLNPSSVAGTHALIHKDTAGLAGWRISLVNTTLSTAVINADYRGVSGTATNIATLTTGTWYHIVVTYATSGIIVYVNGIAGTGVASAFAVPQAANTNPLIIGGLPSGVLGWSPYAGAMDGFRLYNRVLTSPAEVAFLYNSGNGSYGSPNEIANTAPPTGPLLFGVRFDEGTATTLTNYSTALTGTNNATLANGTWTAGNAPLGLTGIGSSLILTGKAFVTYR